MEKCERKWPSYGTDKDVLALHTLDIIVKGTTGRGYAGFWVKYCMLCWTCLSTAVDRLIVMEAAAAKQSVLAGQSVQRRKFQGETGLTDSTRFSTEIAEKIPIIWMERKLASISAKLPSTKEKRKGSMKGKAQIPL